MKTDIEQRTFGNAFLRNMEPELFETLRPCMGLREIFPYAGEYNDRRLTLTDLVVFPIDCQVTLVDMYTGADIAWSFPQSVMTTRFLDGVLQSKMIARTQGHVYTAPAVIALRIPRFVEAISGVRLCVLEAALKWQVDKSVRSLKQNVAAFLLSFNGWEVKKSQQEIGDSLNCRRESITDIFNQFEDHGLIERNGRGRLTILDRSGLQRLADADRAWKTPSHHLSAGSAPGVTPTEKV